MGQRKNRFTVKKLWWVPPAIFCLALAVRLIFLVEGLHVPFCAYRGIDADQYHLKALGLLNGTWPGNEAFFWPPLYPLFLGLLYKTIGQNVTALKTAHMVLGSLNCVLVYFVSRFSFKGLFVPLAAAIICSLYGTMIYFDGQLLSCTLDVFLTLLIIYLLFVAAKMKNIVWWLLPGLFIGLSATNRGGVILFIPIILFWMYKVSRHRWLLDCDYKGPVFWKTAIALLLPVAVIVLPVVLHNLRYDRAAVRKEPQPVSLKQLVSTGFLPIASNLGINFYLGNHWELRNINSINHPEHFIHYYNILDEPAEKGIASTFGQSKYLVRQTFRHIFEKPAVFAKLMALKVFQLFNGVEINRNANLYAFRRHSVMLSMLLWKRIVSFPSGLIIPLGLVGIFLSRDSWRRHFLLLGSLLIQSVFILAFFVTARYRLPAIPLLAIYAAFTLQSLIGFLKHRRKTKAAVPIVLLAALVLFCNSFTGKVETAHGYSEYGNLGNALLAEGKIDKAIFHYKQAVKLAPNYPEAHIRLANALSEKGQTEQAVAHYRKSLQNKTDCYKDRYNPAVSLVKQHNTACYEVHHYLASDLAKSDQNEQAIDHYLESLRLNADQPDVHCDLADLLANQGRAGEAIAHYQQALKLRPGYPNALNNLANTLVRQGRLQEAIRYWQQAIRLNPNEAMLHGNLGRAYLLVGDPEKAILNFEQALKLKPDYISILNKLAWVLATSSNPQYRDPNRALAIAERGYKMTGYGAPELVDTLAAAYAAAGRFDEAIRSAQRALQLAELSKQTELAAKIRNRLDLYQQQKPYHQPIQPKTPPSD